uniref:Protein phosphatase n=1 Tax=Chenopodium quinoa TaxID=63459 RepID=A0A803L3T0_CHEQI
MVVSSSSAFRSSLSSFLLPTKVTKLSLGNRITLLPLSNVAALSSQVTYPIKSEMSLCVGTHLIPHPNKIERGGEDAFFISSHGGGAIAVADGVSGWAERDVDPALFSRELMAHASSMVYDTEVNYDPQVLLKKAHAATSSMGSATVIVAMMEGNGTLKIANVGDCGLRVIRKGQIMFSTCTQEHYFDCPYQLSSETSGQTYLDAMVSSVKLEEGDIVVMGSDGLFDNVYDREIASTVASNSDVAEAAKALARLARDHSMDISFDSPYSSEARTKGIDVPDWKKLLGMKLTGIDYISLVKSILIDTFLCDAYRLTEICGH